MKKNLLFTLLLLLILSTGAVYILFSMTKPAADRGQGFRRKFESRKTVAIVGTLDIKYDSYYIAGYSDHYLYLGNTVAPRHVLIINTLTLDTFHVQVHLNNPDKLEFFAVRVRVDSPDFYLIDGTVPAIFHGTLKDREARLVMNKTAYFLDLEPLSSNAFAVRSLNTAKEAQLGRLTLAPPGVVFPAGLLQKQVDGIFCTEGMMQYDKKNGRLVYVYFYRNQFLVMDSSLSLLYRGNTIDTTTRAKIAITTVSSTGARTFSAPPLVTNHQSCLYGNWLLVNSNVLSDNEHYDDFRHSSVVDIYDITSGRYRSSFYVPDNDGKKLRHFRVMGSRLMALFEHRVVTYDITPHQLNDNSSAEAGKDSLHVKPGRKTEHL